MSVSPRSFGNMELLKVGDHVQKRSGPTGRVTEIDGDNAVVQWDTGEPPQRYGRDEHHYDGGVLWLI